MNHRVPHYFPSVPTDNASSQYNQAVPKHTRATPEQHHHHRALQQDPQSQWSRAATSSPLQLSHRRLQSSLADVARSASEDSLIPHPGSYSVALGPSDWLGRSSTSPHHPPASRHQAASSATPDKRKHRHSIAARQEAKMRRVHCEEGQQSVDGPSRRLVTHPAGEGHASTSFHPSRVGGFSYEDHPAVQRIAGLQDGLHFPPVLDGAGLRVGSAEVSPASKDPPAHSHSVINPCAYPHPHRRDANPTNSYPQVFPSWQSGYSDLQDTGVKLSGGNNPTRTIPYLDNILVHKHRDHAHGKEFQILSQKRFMLENADPAHQYPKGAHHSSLEHGETLSSGCCTGIAKDSEPYAVPVEHGNVPVTEGLHRVIDGHVSGYHKTSHSCQSNLFTPSASMRPLPSFQNIPSHSFSPIPHSDHHRTSLTGGDLRENPNVNEHEVPFHQASQNPFTWDANHLKMHPFNESQGDMTDHPYPFSRKSLHESCNLEQFSNEWHPKTTNKVPASSTNPAQPSSSTYPINLEIHASSSSDPFTLTSSSNEIQISNAKTKILNSPPVSQPKKSHTSHSPVAQNEVPSHNSSSGTQNRSRDPDTMVSKHRKTKTSTLNLSARVGLSSVPDGEERIDNRSRSHTQKDIPELVALSRKKYKGCRCPSGPHSKTDTHNPHRGHSNKMTGEISSGEAMPQSDTSSNHSSSTPNETKGTTRRRRRHAVGLICGVCGDSARSLHFGGVSCDSCKAFFRRAVIAKAYPSFLCVTTGLPPKIKCQKSVKTDSESSKTLGTPDNGSAPPITDSAQPASSPEAQKVQMQTDSHNIQKYSSAAFKSVTEDRLSYTDSGNTSVPTYLRPGSSSNSDEGRHPPSYDAGKNDSSPETLHTVLVQEGGFQGKGPGSKQNQQATRLGMKKIVKCPPITITTRKYCQACRFQRCIDIGMEIGWVTLENDAQKTSSSQKGKSNGNVNDGRPTTSGYSGGSKNEDSCDKDSRKTGEDTNFDLNKYLTEKEQNQIEELIDIYRSVFWGVPEPSYYRPALIDFPPPFALRESTYSSSDVKNEGDQKPILQPEALQCSSPETDNYDGHGVKQCPKIWSEDSQNISDDCKNNSWQSGGQYYGFPNGIEEEEKILESEMSVDEIINLPRDPLGVNKFRKPLMRRPRPWLIRQLMGYTLRFLNVVLKLLKSAGKSLSTADRTELLRQGMTGLTFLNSVFTYDVDSEGWPERVFPPLPLVLQEEDSGASDQPEYLQGIVMHADEVASVVPPHVLETQLTFIRGMKALIGNDCTSVILLMAIMLFDPTHEGLEHPQAVEKIQGNYCHLLKQYVAWKFKNGSPPSPGLGRPNNFLPLSNLPQDICDLLKAEEQIVNGGDENRTMPEEFNELPHSKDLSGLSEIHEKKKCHDSRDIFKFKRPEGMYFSPPYPKGPTNPSSIFPYLMTRMADLKQIAHGYSSSPFLLQGSEVDEIANLVARIEVFMSDIIIATGPGQDNNDHDDGGGGTYGSEGNQDAGDESHVTKPRSGAGKEEFSGSDNGSQQVIGGESLLHEKLARNYETGLSGIHEQGFEWDSHSSEDDSNSIGSQNAMSIGSSLEDLVGVLQAEEKNLRHLTGEEPDEVLGCLDIREKDEPIPNLHETEEYLKSILMGDKKVQMNVLEISKDMNNASYHQVCRYDLQQIKALQDGSHLGEMTINTQRMKASSSGEDNSASLSNYIDSHTFLEVNDGWNKGIHGTDDTSEVQAKVNQTTLLVREENLAQWERAIRDQSSFILGRDKPSERFHDDKMEQTNTLKEYSTHRKDFQQPTSCEVRDANTSSSHEAEHHSLWDRIKATGKALLGLDSSRPQSNQGNFFKGGDNVSEHTTLQGCDGDLENWLNPLERPDSNSSGYVSTVSSPPLQLNAQRDLDVYDSGGDWEDLFQKL
ncbi:uncharacterized protein LOC124169824 [Ischnura elegans]|uniref:uncharacterized protein LOC124169824 n=1 Tax=Ischnura elegans TaxID=197161 RepID=UPI001ED88D6C|nr:uncharacterized protein LOC124169824 [Ischnura elegans]